MKYVKIKAETFNDAMMKLKMEYGDDAIPISHKNVREGGFFNSKLLGRDMVELTAGVQEKKNLIRTKKESRSSLDFTVGDQTAVNNNSDERINLNSAMSALESALKNPGAVEEPLIKNTPAPRENPFALNAPVRTPIAAEAPRIAAEPVLPATAARDEQDPLRVLERDFQDIKATLNKLVAKGGGDVEQRTTTGGDGDSALKPYVDILKNNDFDQEECAVMMNEVRNSISREDLKDKFKIEKSLKDLLKSKIVTNGPFKTGNRKKIIMFFGPTGVGKTTTMAKLGAIYALRECHRVAFVTIDNYRIAATEQLKKYAEIMKIPVHVINDQKAFKEVLDKEKSEIILVDTSGRSHRNDLKISEIKSFADMVEYDFEKILCVSATTKKADLQEVFNAFDKINIDSLIITKVDETSYIGNIIDIADKYKKPISYYTNGQEVPNDITVADAENLATMILTGIQ